MSRLHLYKIFIACLLNSLFFLNSVLAVKFQDVIYESDQTSLPSISRDNSTFCVRMGNFLCISMQAPIEQNEVKFTGRIGKDLSEEQGIEAAQLCALNIKHYITTFIESLSQDITVKCITLTGCINMEPKFSLYGIMAGASAIIRSEFGEHGCTARIKNSLLSDAAIEIDAVFEIQQPDDSDS